jgi:uncharacterized protein (TIRG00374 family)
MPEMQNQDTIAPEEKVDQPVRSRRKLLLKSAISIGLITLIVSQINIRQTIDILLGARNDLLVYAFSLTFVGALLTASRWRILLAAQGVYSSTRHLLICWFTACFFNQLLPSTIGGDAIRIFESWKLGATKVGAAAVIGVDRLLGLFALMIFGVIALYLSTLLVEQHPEIRLLVVGAAIGLGLVATWIFFPGKAIDSIVNKILDILPAKLLKIGDKFRRALSAYRGRVGVLMKAVLLSFALQLNVIMFYYLVGLALELPVTFLDYMLVIPIANVVLLLPITINGVGLREGVFVALLGAFGISPAAAIAFAWASFALFTLFGLLGGVVYAVRKDASRPYA